MTSKIKAAVRIRPFIKTQIKNGYVNNYVKVNSHKKQVQVFEGSSKKCFNFDYIFDDHIEQDDIYNQCNIPHLVEKSLKGYHSTIFAYGQTGSGKTFTMHGDQAMEQTPKSKGIIPRIFSDLFKQIKNQKQRTFMISLSFLQIYNEKIYDLLNPTVSLSSKNTMCNIQNELRLRWNKDEQFSVQNLFIFECLNEEEMMKYFMQGLANRVKSSHKLNLQSSRSHSILTIRIQSFDHSNNSNVLTSKIELVDLAGSERIGLTGAQGIHAKQSIDINKSLFTLKQVISILSDNSRNKIKEKAYVPYRDSKLTSILKRSIGGNSYCLMIACITPFDQFIDENISTLTYATKASYITNQPTINNDPKGKIITELKKQILNLTNELDKANQHIQFMSSLQIKPEIKSYQILQINSKLGFQRKITENDKNLLNQNEFISERLIQSINMVRELLKSNKELREKLQIANKRIDEKDIQIFELTKQNENFKEMVSEDSKPLLNHPKTVNIRKSNSIQKRLPSPSIKYQNNLTSQSEQTKIGFIRDEFSSAKSKNNFTSCNSVQINNLYMNQQGVDFVPTNFSRKHATSTQQKRQISLKKTNNNKQIEKLNIRQSNAVKGNYHRNWKNAQNPIKFMSFYNDND